MHSVVIDHYVNNSLEVFDELLEEYTRHLHTYTMHVKSAEVKSEKYHC
jgi:hypothetical protein